MKYKDLMEELAAHPERTYQRGDWVAYMEGGMFALKTTRFGVKLESAFDDEWQLVRQPVPWQKALREWANGRVVSVYVPEGLESETRKKSRGSVITKYEINKGVWYLED